MLTTSQVNDLINLTYKIFVRVHPYVESNYAVPIEINKRTARKYLIELRLNGCDVVNTREHYGREGFFQALFIGA